MNIQGFFQLSCGRWFTQRTCHQLGQATSSAQTALMTSELLDLDSTEVKTLGETVDLQRALCAMKVSWQEQGFPSQASTSQSSTSQSSTQGTLVMVPLATPKGDDQGQIIQQLDSGVIHRLKFHLDSEQKLILTGDLNHSTLEEHIWFASTNLRLRMTLLKQANQLLQANWYSEVRMGAAPDASPEELPHAASTQ